MQAQVANGLEDRVVTHVLINWLYKKKDAIKLTSTKLHLQVD